MVNINLFLQEIEEKAPEGASPLFAGVIPGRISKSQGCLA
jgi:hypothetical protein